MKLYFRYLFPPQILAQCRKRSARTHNLALYDTNNAVDDLDDVRAALDYNRIILDGGSYGTLFSLVYMRRHGQHVQAALLDGVTAPHFQTAPGSPEGAQKALDDLFARCRRDAACSTRFPRLAEHFTALLGRFDTGPIAVPLADPKHRGTTKVQLAKAVFVDQVRHMLYDPAAEAYLPYIVERAYRGDYTPLAAMIQTVTSGIQSGLAMGAFMSYSCSDWIPFVTPEQIEYARDHTFAGDLRIRAQQQACATWNVPAMPPDFNDPVRSDAPVLMILGSDDPAAPPQYGEAALQDLPNGRAVLVKGAGHGADNACTDRLVLAFLRADSAKDVNVSQCGASFKQPPFATSMKGWP
jgi:pimeloyl-ACP methyl ester carboxylesterase